MSPVVLRFIEATLTTIGIAVLSCLLGLLLSLGWALAEGCGGTWLRRSTVVVLSVIRGLPEILILFAMSNSLGVYFPQWDGWISSIAALALLFSSYASQVLISAFRTIPQGQWESGMALGLSRWMLWRSILAPQGLKHALPGLGNLWLVLLKDTALVSLLGVNDIMNLARNLAVGSHQPFFYLLMASGIYFSITTFSQYLLHHYESHTQ